MRGYALHRQASPQAPPWKRHLVVFRETNWAQQGTQATLGRIREVHVKDRHVQNNPAATPWKDAFRTFPVYRTLWPSSQSFRPDMGGISRCVPSPYQSCRSDTGRVTQCLLTDNTTQDSFLGNVFSTHSKALASNWPSCTLNVNQIIA